MIHIAEVVLFKSTRQFDKLYSYIVPLELSTCLEVGMRVLVPFGAANRSLDAVVMRIALHESVDSIENINKFKEIKQISEETPSFDESMIKLAAWMKNRYISTYGDVFKVMCPPGISIKAVLQVELLNVIHSDNEKEAQIIGFLSQQGGCVDFESLKENIKVRNLKDYISKLESRGVLKTYEEVKRNVSEKKVKVAYLAKGIEEIIEEIENSNIKRIQQIKVLELLMEVEHVSVQDILMFCAVSSSVVNTLYKKGYIAYKEIEVIRKIETPNVVRSVALEPTDEQRTLIDTFKAYVDKHLFKSILIHGITGSGKTEVYLQLIAHCMDMGKDSIVLVPEISLTPQMVERFMSRFGENVAVIHSRLSPGERYDQWKLIKEGKIKVAVGARSAVFAPFKNLGAIIIDEEHESSYKSEVTPKYHAREVAYMRCKFTNSIMIMGSATPSVETYHSALNKRIELYELKNRANKMCLPEVKVVDMRQELNEGNRSLFSRQLSLEIEENIKRSEQTILFLNRRGHSSFVLCRACGITMMCPNCNVSLTHHLKDERIICHYCGYTIKSPKICPKCQSPQIRHFGTGTQKVEDEVKKNFVGASVIRMDMDTTTGKYSHRDLLARFREENINILVGTQMIAKGHDFPKVTLVGVLAADSLLNTGDFRAAEKTFQLITQVAGRAGRAELPGRVIVQTYNTDDFSICCASRHDYKDFYSKEISLREKMVYPPFTNIATIILSGKSDSQVKDKADRATKDLLALNMECNAQATVLGPARAPISKINSRYRWRIIIKCDNMEKIIRILTNVSDRYYHKKSDIEEVMISIEINPLNMY